MGQCFLPQMNKATLRIRWIWDAEFYLQAISWEEVQWSENSRTVWSLVSPEVTPGAYPEQQGIAGKW